MIEDLIKFFGEYAPLVLALAVILTGVGCSLWFNRRQKNKPKMSGPIHYPPKV